MNNSHWIVFFVQRDILPQPFQADFVLYTIIELVGDVFALFMSVLGIYVFHKVKYFHFNLAAIWLNAFLIGIFFVASRFILIPFEFGYLQGTNIAEAIIVNVSTFRFVLWIALYHFEILVGFERISALYFVATYEKVPRRFVSAIIISSNFLISTILGYLIVHKIIHGLNYLSYVFVASNIAYVTFLYLNRAGKRRQKKLLEKYRGYSVSYRWQLQHLIAAAEQLSILMIVTNATVSIILPCIFLPALILENDESKKEIYEVAKLLLQVLLSISFGVVYGIFIIAIPKHREWLFRKNAPIHVVRYHKQMEILSVDAHVSRLEEEWNATLDMKIMRR